MGVGVEGCVTPVCLRGNHASSPLIAAWMMASNRDQSEVWQAVAIVPEKSDCELQGRLGQEFTRQRHGRFARLHPRVREWAVEPGNQLSLILGKLSQKPVQGALS